MAYIANPCVRTNLQVRIVWCFIEIRKREYEADIETRVMEKLVARDDFSIAWEKRKDAPCFVKFMMDCIPTPVL